MTNFKLLLCPIVTILFIIISSPTKAQFYPNTYRGESLWQVNVGVNGLVSPYPPRKPSYGASASIQYGIEPTITVRASVAYNVLRGYYKQQDFNYIPVTLGAMAYVTPNLYVSADAGLAKSNNILKSKNTLWLYVSPGIGYSVPNSGFDVGLHYDVLNRGNDVVSALGLKLSYSINLEGY